MKILHPDADNTHPSSRWKTRVKVKNHFTLSSDPASVMRSMQKIAATLQTYPTLFDDFQQLGCFAAALDLETANHLLDDLYDYCDEQGIWLD